MVNQNEDQPVVVYLRDEGISLPLALRGMVVGDSIALPFTDRDEAVAYLQLLIEWVQVINREPAPTE
jgi:hypothetical protein